MFVRRLCTSWCGFNRLVWLAFALRDIVRVHFTLAFKFILVLLTF